MKVRKRKEHKHHSVSSNLKPTTYTKTSLPYCPYEALMFSYSCSFLSFRHLLAVKLSLSFTIYPRHQGNNASTLCSLNTCQKPNQALLFPIFFFFVFSFSFTPHLRDRGDLHRLAVKAKFCLVSLFFPTYCHFVLLTSSL